MVAPCPYPGMRPFFADEAHTFHGRDSEIAELIGRLQAGEREIFVIGPSGSGKSSLVTADVLPRLARGVAGLGQFVARELRPGEQPSERLGQALELPAGEPLVVADRVAGLLAHRGPDGSHLIVVDQLEEETMVQLWDVRRDQTLTLADYLALSAQPDSERSSTGRR